VKARVWLDAVEDSTGLGTTRTSAATSPDCSFCSPALLIDQDLLDVDAKALENDRTRSSWIRFPPARN